MKQKLNKNNRLLIQENIWLQKWFYMLLLRIRDSIEDKCMNCSSNRLKTATTFDKKYGKGYEEKM